jgi:RHS repeat-associated protein
MRRGSGWAAGGTGLATGSSGLATGGVAPVWAELDGNNQLQARYLSKDALDAVFARLAVGSSGGVTWNLTDRLGSVRAVMNSSGQLVNTLSYDAFGVSSVTAPGVADRFRYAGYQYDAATGLYYVGARWYDPSQGRWLSRDPLGLAADSNPYRYVGNEPTRYVDPRGEDYLDINIGLPSPIGGVWLPVGIGFGAQIGDGPPPIIPGLPRWFHPYIGLQLSGFSINWAPGGQQITPGFNIGGGINLLPQRLNILQMLPRNVVNRIPWQWQRAFVFNGGQVGIGGWPLAPWGFFVEVTIFSIGGPFFRNLNGGVWFVF